jgi:hypothetical protein
MLGKLMLEKTTVTTAHLRDANKILFLSPLPRTSAGC